MRIAAYLNLQERQDGLLFRPVIPNSAKHDLLPGPHVAPLALFCVRFTNARHADAELLVPMLFSCPPDPSPCLNTHPPNLHERHDGLLFWPVIPNSAKHKFLVARAPRRAVGAWLSGLDQPNAINGLFRVPGRVLGDAWRFGMSSAGYRPAGMRYNRRDKCFPTVHGTCLTHVCTHACRHVRLSCRLWALGLD